MAARNLLHKTKLQGFKQYLDSKEIAYREGKGDYQILQVKHPQHGWLVIYEKLDAKEHYSVPWKLTGLVEAFIKAAKPQAGKERVQPLISAGQVWYVKHKGASALSCEEVIDLTVLTVSLRRMEICAHSSRYMREDVDFVEEAACTN